MWQVREIPILLFILFFSSIHIGQGQKAIVFSSSIGYYNYRQTANAFKVYHKLKEYGFRDDDILLMIPENTGCCEKNPLYGSVSFIDNDYTNLNHDVQIDFDYSDINLQRVFDLLRLKFQSYDINKVKLSASQKSEPLFIYITGHGYFFNQIRGNTYFKLRQREALISQNFKHLFRDLALSKRFSKILLLSDSCSAITPFQDVDIDNFTAFASSSWDQKSQSHGFDNVMNAPKSDDFTYYLMEYLQNNDPRHKPIHLQQLFKYMSFDKLNVHAKIVGKGKKYIKTINDFIVKKKNPVLRKKFRLQQFL